MNINVIVKEEKGFGAVQGMLGVLVVILIALLAVIPAVQTAITNASLTGTNQTLANLIPTFIIIGLIVAVVAFFFSARSQ